MSNFYQTLGVSSNASAEEIKQAFFARAKRVHPDVNPAPEALEKMKMLNIAYAALSDPIARADYDRTRKGPIQEKTMETDNTNLSTENSRDLDLPTMSVAASFHQLGILVEDGSGSMLEKINGSLTKAEAVNKATRELFTRFKASNKRDCFSFAVVTFGAHGKTTLGVTPCAQIDDNASYDPTQGHGAGTFIGGGLEEAHRLADDFLKNARPDIPSSVVIVVLSDGACGNPARTKAIADKIKQCERIKICAAFFAVKGQSGSGVLETLEEIVSDPVIGCKTVYDAETLRAFFIASVSAGR